MAAVLTDSPVLRGPTLVLRQPLPRDVADRLELGHDADIVRMFGGDPAIPAPLTEPDVIRWLDGLARHPHAWVIEHDGRLLGEARLDALDQHDARARLALGLLDPAKLGMGLGREVVRLVLQHGFGALRLHRVGLRVVAYNTRAIRCYRACGFAVEGREREAALVAGERHDDIIMGLLAREFASGPGG